MPWNPSWKGYFYGDETGGSDEIVDMDPNALAEKCIGLDAEYRNHGLFLLAGAMFDLLWCGGKEFKPRVHAILEAAREAWPGSQTEQLGWIFMISNTAKAIAAQAPEDKQLARYAQEGAAKVVQGLFPPG